MARRGYPLVGDWPAYLRDPRALLSEVAARPGAVAEVAIPQRTLVLKRPDDVRHVLSANHANYRTTPRLTGRRGRRVIGAGVFTATNDEAGGHRREIQPLLGRRALAPLETAIRARADRMMEGWRPGASIELAPLARRLAEDVACDAVVGRDAPAALARGLAIRRREKLRTLQGALPLPGWLPLAMAPAGRRALRDFESALAGRIADRRARPRDDVVSGLAARGADERRIRDEALSLALAGIEAVKSGTAAALMDVARHPDVARRVREEVAAADGAAEEPRELFPYTEQAVMESLRLDSPSPVIMRLARGEDTLPSGARVRARSRVIVSPYVLHRDPALFPDPERYDPDRFEPEARRARPSFAYIPFGAGPRACIGRNLAMLEIVLTVARVVERFELEADGDSAVRVHALTR
jgi:cytochrome P450